MKLIKQKGSIADIMSTCICVLAMSVLLLFFLQWVEVIQQKQAVSQLARKYILRMETTGCLGATDRTLLETELLSSGVTETCLEGTSMNMVGYGEPITLLIRGRLKGGFAFEEKRVSTAKN